MLDIVNDHFRKLEKSDALDAVDTNYQRAYALISSQKAREAFDIGKEPAAIRDEYGRNEAGARMLLARRLVEAGVRFVTLTYAGWDHHDNIAGNMRGQLPVFDQAFAALIRDLDRRKLLDSTHGVRHYRIWPHAEDQRHRRSRPLAQGIQRRHGRRRHCPRSRLRQFRRHRRRTAG